MKKKCARIPVLLCFAAVLLFFHTAACAKAEKTQLNKLKLTVRAGKTKVLKMKGTNKKVFWKSSNRKVASVSADGVVSGISRGTLGVFPCFDRERNTQSSFGTPSGEGHDQIWKKIL